jgi:hypothetical protein
MSNEIELSVSCSDCVRRATPDCADCLVSYVLGDEPDSLQLDASDAQIIDLFVSEGLVPRLKFVSLSPRR